MFIWSLYTLLPHYMCPRCRSNVWNQWLAIPNLYNLSETCQPQRKGKSLFCLISFLIIPKNVPMTIYIGVSYSRLCSGFWDCTPVGNGVKLLFMNFNINVLKPLKFKVSPFPDMQGGSGKQKNTKSKAVSRFLSLNSCSMHQFSKKIEATLRKTSYKTNISKSRNIFISIFFIFLFYLKRTLLISLNI